MYHRLAREPLLSRRVMLVLWHKQGNEYVDVEEGDHRGRLRVRTVRETGDILNFQDRGAGAARKRWHSPFEPDIGLGHSAQQSSDELINVLPGLGRKISDPCLEYRVDCDAGGGCHG
jgi:hypothetical protein